MMEKNDLSELLWTDCDPDDEHYEKVYPVIQNAACEMLKKGFPEVLVGAFLHKLVEIAVYDAEISFIS